MTGGIPPLAGPGIMNSLSVLRDSPLKRQLSPGAGKLKPFRFYCCAGSRGDGWKRHRVFMISGLLLGNLHDCLGDPSSDRDNFENQDLIALVRQIAGEKMRPRHRLVLHLKYPGIFDAEELSSVHALSEGRNTLSAIGRYLGVSRERARQIHEEAVAILRREIRRRR